MNRQARIIVDKFKVSTSKVLSEAASFGARTNCRRCGKREWNVVPLYEYGDQRQPSQVVLFCRHCGHNEPYAVVPYKQAISYAEQQMMNKRAEEIAREDRGFDKVGTENTDKHVDLDWQKTLKKNINNSKFKKGLKKFLEKK